VRDREGPKDVPLDRGSGERERADVAGNHDDDLLRAAESVERASRRWRPNKQSQNECEKASALYRMAAIVAQWLDMTSDSLG